MTDTIYYVLFSTENTHIRTKRQKTHSHKHSHSHQTSLILMLKARRVTLLNLICQRLSMGGRESHTIVTDFLEEARNT